MRATAFTTILLSFMLNTTATFAADCVPTKTPEQANAILQQGISSIQNTLQVRYNLSLVEYNNTVNREVIAHNARVLDARNELDDRLIQLAEEAKPGWREASEAAVNRYNLAVQESEKIYLQISKTALENYERSVEAAKTEYNARAKALTDEYNKSVCAAPGRR